MNVFSNVSNQVSGLGSSLGSWFKKDGKEEGGENQPPAEGGTGQTQSQEAPAQTPTPAPAPPPPPKETTKEKHAKASGEENEDATSQHSGATEGADSHPTSEAEEEADGKAGFASGFGLHLSGVSSRASASAKSVGSFFSTAFSKAGASVKEASSRIKDTVEKSPLLSEFNKEQEAFIAAKGGKAGQALPPWVGYPQEEKLKEEILALSTDRRNFVRSPPQGVNFEFDLEQFHPVAEATLAADENLEKMRFELVPKVVNEESFWRNYFYRVGLIRQSSELSSLEKEPAQTTESDQANTEEKKGEADWEAELREELGEDLGEYEVVGGAKDNEKWEEELQNMIDDEDTSDLR